MIIKRESGKTTTPVPGITRRILAHSERVMLTEHALEKDAVLPAHKHPHDQLVDSSFRKTNIRGKWRTFEPFSL